MTTLNKICTRMAGEQEGTLGGDIYALLAKWVREDETNTDQAALSIIGAVAGLLDSGEDYTTPIWQGLLRVSLEITFWQMALGADKDEKGTMPGGS